MITDRMEALGVRLARDEIQGVLRSDGAMALPGSLIRSLVKRMEKHNADLKTVPADWYMTYGELATAGLI